MSLKLLYNSRRSFRPCSFCLITHVNRFTQWPEAVPAMVITAEKTTHALVECWEAKSRCPLTATTNRGRQFESVIFRCLITLLRITRFRTTAYHSQENRLAERFRWQLKASLLAADLSQWTDALTLVLLGIRNVVKAYIGYTATQLLCRKTLPLLGKLWPFIHFSERGSKLLHEQAYKHNAFS